LDDFGLGEAFAPGGLVEILVGVAGAVGDEFVVWEKIGRGFIFHVLSLGDDFIKLSNKYNYSKSCFPVVIFSLTGKFITIRSKRSIAK
jgi:hypothetical protein